jgi:ribosomal protein S18 acetylase RimI-like enzyme
MIARAFIGEHEGRSPGLTFRPIRDSDQDFLCALYASTRADELAPVPWSAEEKRQFLQQQFSLQHRHYQQVYPDADYLLVLHAGDAIGRIYLARDRDALNLIDIALLPEWRGRGIGSALLAELIDEAEREYGVIELHVESNNPAKRLYERLGFALVENRGVYDLMRRLPRSAPSSG